MAEKTEKEKLSKKPGLVAISRNPFLDDEIKKLTAKLKKFALVFEGDFFIIYGE